MVIVRLKGGLGNQMFQYAAAKRVAFEKELPLKLDLTFLEADAIHHTKRGFELNKLMINTEIATAEEVKAIRKKRWGNFFCPVRIKDRGVADFTKKIARCGAQVYLDGYWQSEQHFAPVADIIRDEFTFREPIVNDYLLSIKQRIENSTSVSLHFRRGDYVNNPRANKHHGVCSMSYYQNAVNIMAHKTDNPLLFIFSDDIQWVKANFKSDHPMLFVEQSDEGLHSDFRLMSLCKHNIIANSSYSWWAAWLNDNENKTVIAPRQWYQDSRAQSRVAEMIPKEWVTI